MALDAGSTAWTAARILDSSADGVKVSGLFSELRQIGGWASAENQVRELMALDDGWEDDALAPDAQTILLVLELVRYLSRTGHVLPPSRVGPTFLGEIAIEWQFNGNLISAEISSNGVVKWLHMDPEGQFRHWNEALGGSPVSIDWKSSDDWRIAKEVIGPYDTDASSDWSVKSAATAA